MRFEFQIHDPQSRDLFEAGAGILEKVGRTKLIDKTSKPIRDGVDGILTVTAPAGQTVRFACEARRTLSANALAPITERLCRSAAVMKARPMLVAPHIGESIGEQLRTNDIAYLDAAGNAFLKDSFLHIWLRGFKPIAKPERPIRAFQPSGLQLIALLLCRPSAIEWPYRRLADNAGIALGSISRILGDLRSQGFVRLASKGKNALMDWRELLAHWEFGYATRLRAQLEPQTYRQAEGIPLELLPERIPHAMKDEVLVGGELAAAIATKHLRPQTAAFHVSPHWRLSIIKEMKLVPDRGGNIFLLEQFGDMSAWRWEEHKADRLVHPLFIRAELLQGRPDSRLVETATLIFNQFIAPMFKDE